MPACVLLLMILIFPNSAHAALPTPASLMANKVANAILASSGTRIPWPALNAPVIRGLLLMRTWMPTNVSVNLEKTTTSPTSDPVALPTQASSMVKKAANAILASSGTRIPWPALNVPAIRGLLLMRTSLPTNASVNLEKTPTSPTSAHAVLLTLASWRAKKVANATILWFGTLNTLYAYFPFNVGFLPDW